MHPAEIDRREIPILVDNQQAIKQGLDSESIRAQYLVWGAPLGSHRSQLIAQALRIGIEHVYFTSRQGRIYAPVKYTYQMIRTLLLLADRRPNLVFVQNPPVFAALTVYIFCKLFGAKYIIDSHTDALLASWWAWSIPLQGFLSRQAITTLVTNKHLEEIVIGWGADALVLAAPPIYKPTFEEVKIDQEFFNVMFVSSVSYDEPIDKILSAAKNLDDVRFYVTGKYQELRSDIVENAPGNVYFTGFLPDEQYYGLMKAVQVVMCLTTENHTHQAGANEALWMGKPVITSDWPILREQYDKGTIHVNNSVESITEAIFHIKDDLHKYEQEIYDLQIKNKQSWEKELAKLFVLVNNEYADQ